MPLTNAIEACDFGTFASMTETADYILKEVGLRRRAVVKWGPMQTQEVSEVRAGRFLLIGFAGNSAPDQRRSVTFASRIFGVDKVKPRRDNDIPLCDCEASFCTPFAVFSYGPGLRMTC